MSKWRTNSGWDWIPYTGVDNIVVDENDEDCIRNKHREREIFICTKYSPPNSEN